jgi:hypothetical protein
MCGKIGERTIWHVPSGVFICTVCREKNRTADEMAERIFQETREAAAKWGDVARPRVKPKPRKALLTAEEGYDAAMVDYSDHIRALTLADVLNKCPK